MAELARIFFNIALLRRGPQDLPASKFLLGALLLVSGLVNLAVALAFELDTRLMLARFALAAVLSLVLTIAILSVASRPQRFLQTATALIGAELVTVPLALLLFILAKPYHDFTHHPPWLQFLDGLYEAWNIVIAGYVYRMALERSLLAGVLLAFACEIIVVLAVQGAFPPPA
ncbi:MAG TPA: hypothetical protein VE046_15130 [Steroidobacteraceae bacterium]|nr:hypothetical protein [Steroidobacteraceae bacterium]